MARAATSPELTLFRSPGHGSKLYAAVLAPATVYTARINQSFSTLDQVLELTYDTGSGTLSDVLPDMTLLVGSSAGAHDIGICRVRSIDGTKVYIGETSDVRFANDQYLTILRDWSLWAKHVLISAGVPYMDGGIAYSDQHASFDPVPVLGSHRVLKLESATVSASFDGSGSYVYDSSISGYAWTAPGSSSSSGMTTATPTITWNAVGWHPIYLTVTAANGKSFFAVRWVYVWSDDDPPPSASIGSCRAEAESGGWQFQITLYDNVDLATVRDRALVILFAEDWYGSTKQSIGPLVGSENVIAVGWIGGEESINWNPEAGQVEFTVYGAHHWFGKIPSFPDGVEFTASTPAAWTEMQNLTVDRGVWHFLHWRSTATRILDVQLSGDTKYTKEVSSLGQNLWGQLREMAFLQIFARPGVDRYGRFFLEVHPQLVPEGDRAWPTVMTLTKADWEEEIDFDRLTVTPNALVNLAGVAVDSAGNGAPFFSLSPGHAYPHYGSLEIVDNVLLSSQLQANTLAGLYRGWLNNPYPNIPIVLSANNRLIDCFPRQQCAIAIATGDTPRGISYTGNLLPTSVAFVHDPQTGYLHTEVAFEAQTVADLAINGDIPGSRADQSIPPTPRFPPLPDLPIILPGTTPPSVEGPVKVLLHDTTKGLIYSEDFQASSPHWETVNAGLSSGQYAAINMLFICPNGAVYVGYLDTSRPYDGNNFLFRAPAIGGTFVQQTIPDNLVGMAGNPTVPETIAILTNTNHDATATFRVGANNSFSAGVTFTDTFPVTERISFGLGNWLITRFTSSKYWIRINAAGTSILATGTSPNINQAHLRASTTGITYHNLPGDVLVKAENNLATYATVNSVDKPLVDPGALPQWAGVDATGMYLMTRCNSAPLGQRGKSSDGGATWASIGLSLPISAAWHFRNAGSPQRWIAASEVVGYSSDFGVNWVSKDGDLHAITATPHINIIRVIQA